MKQSRWKSRKIRSWVITRNCLFSDGQYYSAVLCLLPSRFRPKTVARIILALHETLGSDLFGKHYFAASARKRREQSLSTRYNRVSINDNPSTEAVLAENVVVESIESGYHQVIKWTDPDVYRHEPGKKPVKEVAGKRQRYEIKLPSETNTVNERATWGLTSLLIATPELGNDAGL